MRGRASALRVRIRRPHHTKDVRKISFEYEPLSRGVDSKKKKLVVSFASDHARIQGEGGGLENYKNKGFFSNTGLGPLENHKATKPAFIVGLSSAR